MGFFNNLLGKKKAEEQPKKSNKKSKTNSKKAKSKKTGKKKANNSNALPLPDDIKTMLSNAGRVDFELLVELAKTHKQLEFETFLTAPVIAGSAVKPGIIRSKSQVPQSTQMFNPSAVTDDVLEEISQNAIYPLLKGMFATNPDNTVFTVGRESSNDLVIPDLAISKLHSKIRLDSGQYWVQDCGSTNGTSVNGKPLEPDEEIQIVDNDRGDFGRYEFKFYKPQTFAQKLRRIEL
ncbi:MAG: FHA domain-containing protein [Methylococcales bacterium]|nr:FHA domain-containing protein [Methylococcales bacterium]MBT7444727.1 FHA domain-containing protein [Methylococcales bacterium]